MGECGQAAWLLGIKFIMPVWGRRRRSFTMKPVLTIDELIKTASVPSSQ